MYVCINILTYEQYICTCNELLRPLRLVGGAIKAFQLNWPSCCMYTFHVLVLCKYEINL
jgi:hypothetical protein